MTTLKLFKTFLLLTLTTSSFAQQKDWTKDEQVFYATMKSLCEHFKGKPYDTTQRDFVFKEFVYFDNILRDTSKIKMQGRIQWFDGLFYRMTHFIDSIGLENLDAKPTRFFKDNKQLFDFIEKNRNNRLKELIPLTLTWFDKRRPNEPIAPLLFEPKTHKLLAWILIHQGDYSYFLTFNLL